jgi:cell division protein FtsI (penicillin-binding protein 3)
VYNYTITDAHDGGFGKLSLAHVFTESSNVGMAKVILDNYRQYPSSLLERLYSMGINDKVNVRIIGEKAPFLPVPGTDEWSGLSLPWMAYGYGVHMTPLQILTFYNAIANDGVQMKPYFVSKIKDENQKIKTVRPEVINPRICSEKNVRIAQALLEGVVDHGTGVRLKMKGLTIAGKTGTTQVDYWKKGQGGVQYRASFVGYFPVDNPKYSAIVVVNKPNKRKGYYGATVAGPVFKEIAVKIYHDGPEVQDTEPMLDKDELLKQINDTKTANATRKNIMPNVKGIPAQDAIYLLENMGLKVTMSGSGIVRKQSIRPGQRVRKNNRVNLVLM